MVDTSYAKIADAWVDSTATFGTGGGRHTAVGPSGELYTLYFERQPNTDLRAMVAKYTVAGGGAVTVAGTYEVFDFQDNTVHGVQLKHYEIAASVCLDDAGATQRVLVALTNANQHEDKIWLYYMDVASPGTFSVGDNFRINSYLSIRAHEQGFQIIGRNGSGNIWIVYSRHVYPGQSLSRFTSRTLAGVGATWSAETAIDTAQTWPSTTLNPQRWLYCTLAAQRDSAGDIHMVGGYIYAATPKQTDVVYAKYSGGSWSTPASIWNQTYYTTNSLAFELYPMSLAIDADDNPHAVWGNDESYGEDSAAHYGTRIVYASYSGSWSTSEAMSRRVIPGTNWPSWIYRMSLGIDGSGNPHIMWSGKGFIEPYTAAPTLNYAEKNSGTWARWRLTDPYVGGWWGAGIPHDVNPYPTLGVVNCESLATSFGSDDAEVALVSIDGFALGGTAAADETLTVAESVAFYFTNEHREDVLTVGERVLTALKASDALTLSEQANTTRSVGLRDELTLAETASYLFWNGEDPSETLTVGETVTTSGDFWKKVQEALTVTDRLLEGTFNGETLSVGETVTASGPIKMTVSETLSVIEHADVTPAAFCETDYVPDPDVPSDPDTLLTVEFTGPFYTPTLSMQLKRPDFGDVRDIVTKNQIGKTEDGNFVIYHNDPISRKFTLTWTQLSRRQALEAENFLEQMRGQLIRYRDYNGHNWQVYSLENPAIVTDDPEQATVTMVLEGTQVD